MPLDLTQPCYHGSPFDLKTIRKGSTVTQRRDLARIFSHKPTLVSVSDGGQIKHNGTTVGYLYTIAEKMLPEDVVPHPHSAMAPGEEWLTTRELRLSLLHSTEPAPGERFTEAELAELQAQQVGRQEE